MNKFKEYLWTRPNEWFDDYDIDNGKFILLPILPTLVVNAYYSNIAVWFYLSCVSIYAIYRLIGCFIRSKPYDLDDEPEQSEFNFTPVFFKSSTREQLFGALESAKTSRQLAAALENTSEFDYWEIVIEDIENLIENYSD
jgi:hypothetical protein